MRLTILVVAVCTLCAVNGQTRTNIFASEESSLKFEALTSLKFMELSGISAIGYEIGCGGIYGGNWNIGLRFSQTSTVSPQMERTSELIRETRTSLMSGGLYIGYIHQPQRLVHFRSELGLDAASWKREASPMIYREKIVLLIQPRFGLEANITSWMSLSGWLGYQWIYPAENGRIRPDSPQGLISLRFGNF
mgnify:CR=1 FL=1